jgi:hypothetical protein
MNRRVSGWLLLLIILAALALVAVPVFVIMPFKVQTPGGIALSFALRRWSPLVTALGLAGGLALVVLLWRGSNRWRRVLLAVALIPLGVAAWFARQNHFEWMFRPLPGATRVDLLRAGFVGPADMVMGVVVNGIPVAYPVNQVAYHHVVNDTVGGVPIAVTY